LAVKQILQAIEEGEYCETNGQQAATNSLDPMGGMTKDRSKVGKEAKQRQNESAEDCPAKDNNPFMQQFELFPVINTLVQQFAFLELKQTQYSLFFDFIVGC
jgi:hypothetical protein